MLVSQLVNAKVLVYETQSYIKVFKSSSCRLNARECVLKWEPDPWGDPKDG